LATKLRSSSGFWLPASRGPLSGGPQTPLYAARLKEGLRKVYARGFGLAIDGPLRLAKHGHDR
jgi:hypothetical protein